MYYITAIIIGIVALLGNFLPLPIEPEPTTPALDGVIRDMEAFGASIFKERQGGTGTGTYTTGDILYSDGANSLAKLGVGNNGEFLKVAGGNVTWGTGAAGDVFAWTDQGTYVSTSTDLQFPNATTTGSLYATGELWANGDFHAVNATTTNSMYVTGDLGVGVWDLTDIKSIANGTFAESFDALVVSDGTTASTTLEKVGGGDLTAHFSDGHYKLDCTPISNCTVQLTAGTDASPTANYIYLLQSNKTLTRDTSWAATEHIKVGYFLCPSVALINTNGGCYINQNWNDHLTGADNMGHLAHIAERSRTDGAYYFDGIDPNGTSGYLTITAGNVEFIATSGNIFQMHKQSVSAFSTASGDEVLVVNWNGDAYHNITNLHDIVADADGDTLNVRWFNMVVWGVANKGSEGYSPIMINLPTCSYASQAQAQSDSFGCDVYTVPRAFDLDSSTGYLIARITVKQGDTWSYGSAVDLRGLTDVSAASGGVSSAQVNFADNTFTIFDEADNTKITAFDVGTNVTTGNTRTIKVQDADGTMALLEGTQVFTGQITTPLLFATSTLLDNATTTGTHHFGSIEVSGDYISDFAGTGLSVTAGTLNAHAIVTLAGTPNYLTLSGQEITLTVLDTSDDTNLAVTAPIVLTDDTISIDQTANFAWTGSHDFGGGVIEIPNGTGITLNAIGEFGLDTAPNTWQGSGGQLLVATSTEASAPAVVGRALTELYSFTISSSTDLIAADIFDMPVKTTAFRVVRLQCYVGNGTSQALFLSDGTNDTNSITCGSDPGKYNTTTSNFEFTAGEKPRTELGTNTGNVESVSVTAVGYYERE